MFAKLKSFLTYTSEMYHVPSHVGATDVSNVSDCDRQIALMNYKTLRPFLR